MSPLPAETNERSANIYATPYQIDRFLQTNIGPEEVQSSVIGQGDIKTYLFEALGLPLDLNTIQPVEMFAKSTESAEYRVFASPNFNNVYIQQRRVWNRHGFEYKPWAYPSLFKLGESKNRRYRDQINRTK
jgi:hypothetical protein